MTCQCGCGRLTTVYQGKPRRFIHNHHGRKNTRYIVDDNGCWIWQLSTFENGYGKLDIDGKTVHAHRYYYEQAKGAVPENLVLDHLCRNPNCCNPDHLESVTVAENTRRGKLTKLTAQSVKTIRERYEGGGITQEQLAQEARVSQSQISRIVRGLRWR